MTLDQLKKRECALVNRCFLCGEDEESIEHILIHCSKVWELWTLLFASIGIDWVIPFLVRDLLLGWQEAFIRKSHRKI